MGKLKDQEVLVPLFTQRVLSVCCDSFAYCVDLVRRKKLFKIDEFKWNLFICLFIYFICYLFFICLHIYSFIYLSAYLSFIYLFTHLCLCLYVYMKKMAKHSEQYYVNRMQVILFALKKKEREMYTFMSAREFFFNVFVLRLKHLYKLLSLCSLTALHRALLIPYLYFIFIEFCNFRSEVTFSINLFRSKAVEKFYRLASKLL